MKGLPWLVAEDALGGNRIHSIPVDDEREHVALSTCWCNPSQPDEESPTLWSHHSIDRREDYETGKRKMS